MSWSSSNQGILTGAAMTLYEVKDDDTLEQVGVVQHDEPDCDDLRAARPQALLLIEQESSGRILPPYESKIWIMRTATTAALQQRSRTIIRMC